MPDPNQIAQDGMKGLDPKRFLTENGGVGNFFKSMQPEPVNDGGFKPAYSKAEQIKNLTERVDSLERLIRITFNGHVLINGQFVKITV